MQNHWVVDVMLKAVAGACQLRVQLVNEHHLIIREFTTNYQSFGSINYTRHTHTQGSGLLPSFSLFSFLFQRASFQCMLCYRDSGILRGAGILRCEP